MNAQATEHADVVVVGAGPTGLLLAGDLAEAGVRVVLLERRAGQSNLARAFAVHARTMEQLRSAASPTSWPRPGRRSTHWSSTAGRRSTSRDCPAGTRHC